jgi:microcompartment protein CcmK/EutM
VREWDRWQNKDEMSQDTIEEEAAALADELKEEYVEVKTTVSGVDLNLGDTVHVEKTENGVKVLDRDMRVHQLTTRSIDGTPAGTEQEVTLSTRTVAREELNSDKRDIQRFNTAFQGSSVVIQGGGSRQPVNASLNAEIPFYYPNVEFENNAELFVRGLPYRAYSSGAASGGGSTVTSQNNADFSNVADTESSVSGFSSSGFGTVDTFTPSVDSSELYVFGSVTSVSGEGTFSFDYRLENTTTGNFVPNSNGFTATSQETTDREVFLVEATDVNGDAIEFQMDTAGNSAAITLYYLATGQHTHRVMFPNHTHPVDAGIIEFGAETPSNVDVLVDGTTVATDIGSGTFETTVNLDGDLTSGAWNDIELSSDSLGHLQATVSIQAYDQIGSK